MFTRCLFCHRPFPENDQLNRIPRGRRIAFDPALGRLWVVCETCHRWNLCPIEDRHSALYELERIVRDQARVLTHTANISLLLAPGLTLIRVGDAGRAEQAWWRYGRELRRRRLTHDSTGSRVSAAAFGAVAYLLQSMGLTDRDVPIDWTEAPVTDVLRWRRFGWAAWYGRERCPHCLSTLRALRYESSWWAYPIRGEDDRTIGLGVPCQRCDPWTPDKVYEIRGDEAENVLRRVLAYQNIAGASERRITDAANAIEHAGSATDFALAATSRRESLWRMGPTNAIALEIALSETAERRLLGLEATALEFLWKREEALARIIDEELTPRRLLETHLRRLPVTLSRSPVFHRGSGVSASP